MPLGSKARREGQIGLEKSLYDHSLFVVVVHIGRAEEYYVPEASQKNSRYVWPEEAERLVSRAKRDGRAEKHPLLLEQQLESLTGFSNHACWRYLNKHGVKRPGTGKRRQWDEKAVDFVMEQGYDAAVQKFKTSKKALYSFMQRNNRSVGQWRGEYSLHHVRKLLSVRTDTILSWIKAGYMEATPTTFAGKDSYIISQEQLRKFLSKHSGDLMPRRLPEKRIAFLSEFLFEGKHADLGLLRTRESKKEGEAFRNGEYLNVMQSPVEASRSHAD